MKVMNANQSSIYLPYISEKLWNYDSYESSTFVHQSMQYLVNQYTIKIMLNTPLNAGLFMPIEQNENNNKTTLLMPIRLNDQ